MIDQNTLTHVLLGAIGALALAWRFGYLRIPSAPASSPVIYTQTPVPGSPTPTYESMINIPHKVAITPQVEVK